MKRQRNWSSILFWIIYLTQAEARATTAEQRFAAAGNLFIRLFAEEKRQ